MSKNLIIVILGTALFLLVLDETCIWDFIPDKCTEGVKVDDSTIVSLASNLGYDICACDNRKRYAEGTIEPNGGSTISFDDAKQYLRNFKDGYSTPMYGAFISKLAIDRIFCADPKANGIYCYTGLAQKLDPNTPTDACIIIEGTTRADYEIETNTAGLIFRTSPKTLCPDQCGLVGAAASGQVVDTMPVVTGH